jgi:hypothetical protein
MVFFYSDVTQMVSPFAIKAIFQQGGNTLVAANRSITNSGCHANR